MKTENSGSVPKTTEKLCYGNEFEVSGNQENALTSTILRKVMEGNLVGRTYCTTNLLTLNTLDWKIINSLNKTFFSWKRLLIKFFNAPVSSVQFSLAKLEKKDFIETANEEETTLFKASLLVNGFQGIGPYQLDKIQPFKLLNKDFFESLESDLDQLFSIQEMQSVSAFAKKIEENKQTILAAERRKNEKPKIQRICYTCRKKHFSENGKETYFYKGLPLMRPVWICNKCKEASE
jgi:hypothetical protein